MTRDEVRIQEVVEGSGIGCDKLNDIFVSNAKLFANVWKTESLRGLTTTVADRVF